MTQYDSEIVHRLSHDVLRMILMIIKPPIVKTCDARPIEAQKKSNAQPQQTCASEALSGTWPHKLLRSSQARPGSPCSKYKRAAQ